MHLFSLAIALEKEFQFFYEKLSAESESLGLKKIFLEMAADEKKHCAAIVALEKKSTDIAMKDSVLVEEGQALFSQLVWEKPSFTSPEGLLEAYRYAMKIEADSTRLYLNAAESETEPSVKKILLRIAAEEEKHFVLIQNIYHFVNAPNEYLAWGEFSNIGEYTNFGREVDV